MTDEQPDRTGGIDFKTQGGDVDIRDDAIGRDKTSSSTCCAANPLAVYPLGTFQIHSNNIVVVDAFGSAEYAVTVQNAMQGAWHAYAGVENGIHVALFAYHSTALPDAFPSAQQLLAERAWLEVGAVPIDTATCAIAEAVSYQPLVVEESHHEITGIRDALCFSHTGYGDGGYAVFTDTQEGLAVAIAVQFVLSDALMRS